MANKAFLLTNTEQFKVFAASEEEAREKFVADGDKSPDVHWMGVTDRTVEEISG